MRGTLLYQKTNRGATPVLFDTENATNLEASIVKGFSIIYAFEAILSEEHLGWKAIERHGRRRTKLSRFLPFSSPQGRPRVSHANTSLNRIQRS